jgi:hypothetical protein
MTTTTTISKKNVQVLSISQITVDRTVQSRVATSISDEKEFSAAMLDGDEFPPVVVLWDGKKYWLADGFHRVAAAKAARRIRPKMEGIRAQVIEGTKRDAIIYSAGANKRFSIKRTPEDIKRSIYMLLDDDEWRDKPNVDIARHVGVKPETVRNYRIEYHTENNIVAPILRDRLAVHDRLAGKRKRRRDPVRPSPFQKREHKYVYHEYRSPDKNPEHSNHGLSMMYQKRFFDQGFHFSPCFLVEDDRNALVFSGTGAGVNATWISCTFFNDECVRYFIYSVGYLTLLRSHLPADHRMVIITNFESFDAKTPRRLTQLAIDAGIEVRSSDGFLESLIRNDPRRKPEPEPEPENN